MISSDKIQDIAKRIEVNYQPEKIILFGSYAANTSTEDSDLDFILIKDTDTKKTRRSSEVRKHLIGLCIPMDIKVYTPYEFNEELHKNHSFLKSALKKSKVLYERK